MAAELFSNVSSQLFYILENLSRLAHLVQLEASIWVGSSATALAVILVGGVAP